jgi:ABC-type transport system involved in cytochrome bd biosynthesis fused ATPase/permease subunit
MFHKRLLKEFKENQKLAAGMVMTQWITLLANVVLVFALALFVSNLLQGQTQGKLLWILPVTLIAVMLVRGIANTVNQKLSFQASSNVKRRLRELTYEKLMRLGTKYHENIATSEAVQISTEGVDQLEIYFGKYVPQFFYSLLAPLTLFVIVGTMSMKVAAVLLLCVPLIPISIIAVQKFAKKMLKKYWGTYTELGDSFLENLQGLTTLKIYQADERYAEKMDEEAEKFRKVTMRVLIMQLNSISVMDIVAYGGAAIGMILSVLELRAGAISLAQCFFITMVSAEFFLPLRMLGSFFHIAMNGNEAANKIFALLDSAEKEKGTKTSCDGDTICFSHVTFGYEEQQQVLKDVSFTIPEKSFTAIVGVSGCGKSTTASLLMGDLGENSGEITIGGVQVKELEEAFLHKKIIRVRHDSYLFAGTLRNNLAMAMKLPDEDKMYAALKQVELYDTVMEKGGLSMEITEKAANLSGGQKQRVALARAMLHDSDIYIFDEAASNVDVESENKIMEVITELAKEKTVILISHRLANVVNADQVLVMKDGIVEESGTHEKLMEKHGYYSELFIAQKELENFAK